MIADEFQDGVPGYYSDEFFVRKDSGISKVEDIKGKVTGTNAAGSAVDIAMKAMLHKRGLEDKRDYTTIEAPLGAMPAMLAEKKVDLVPGAFCRSRSIRRSASRVPFCSHKRKASAAPKCSDVEIAADLFSTKIVPPWPISSRTCCESSDGISTLKTMREVAVIAAKLSKMPPETWLDWLFTHQDYYRDPDGRPDLDALEQERRIDT